MAKKNLKNLINLQNLFKENSSGESLPGIKVNNDILSKNIVEVISYVNKDISKSEIRRLIKSNAIKIDNQSIKDEKYIIRQSLFLERGFKNYQ